jgi:ATP phosphoribosyltransferase
VKNQLKLGVPKGSLQNATIALFKRSGWNINVNGRSYFPEIDDDTLECAICRAQEMSNYVESGTLDVGLTGKDWIAENESDIHVVTDLVYSKVSSRPARWVLAVPFDSPIKKIEDCEGKKISTEMTNFTRRYFKERNINVSVEFSCKAHGLRVIHELMQTNTQLIANHNAWKDAEKRAKIEQIALLLKGALQGEKMVGIKMNVPEEKMEDVIGMLPSLNAPTVAPLYHTKWFSVEIVVSSDVVRDLIPELLKHGAEGIIEYPLNKVI